MMVFGVTDSLSSAAYTGHSIQLFGLIKQDCKECSLFSLSISLEGKKDIVNIN